MSMITIEPPFSTMQSWIWRIACSFIIIFITSARENCTNQLAKNTLEHTKEFTEKEKKKGEHL